MVDGYVNATAMCKANAKKGKIITAKNVQSNIYGR